MRGREREGEVRGGGRESEGGEDIEKIRMIGG